nr:MAG TPA: attachment protein [Inoviridae sp.]
MHNHVDHRWIKTFLRKIISILLVYSLFFTNTAHAAVGGWELKNPVAQGASSVYDATKNVVINGKKFIKESSVKITPTATSVAKVLARGAAGYALSVAVEQLLGSVDWVLDPANNQIKYSDPSASDGSIDPTDQYIYSISQFGKSVKADSPSAACSALVTALNTLGSTVYKVDTTQDRTSYFWCNLTANGSPMRSNEGSRLANPAYDPTAEKDKEKSIPLDVVAQKVISNAAGGDTAAQAATTAAAADIVAEAEKDDAKARPIASQAEANATTKPADAAEAEKANEAQGEAKPNEANPEATDLSLTFPIFCNWAPTICEAAQTVITFPNTLTEWWETANSKAEEWETSISEAWAEAKDWAKNDEIEDSDNDPPEIKEIDIGALDTSTFKGVPGCPAPIPVSINIGTGGETEISYEPICQLADKWSFVAPLIGFLSGALIIVGVGRKGEDGEI